MFRFLEFVPISTVEVYDPTTDTWMTATDMPTPRGWLSASVVSDKIYVIGGAPSGFPINQGGLASLSTVEAYDSVTDTWEKRSDMPTVRGWLSTGVVDGFIYAIGGTSNWPTPISTVEAYNTGVGSGFSGIRVLAITPKEGRVTGGQSLAIGGIGFPPDAVVTIDGVPLIDLKVTAEMLSK